MQHEQIRENLAYLMAIVAGEATGRADPCVAGRDTSQTGEDRLPLHVPIGVSAFLALIPSQN